MLYIYLAFAHLNLINSHHLPRSIPALNGDGWLFYAKNIKFEENYTQAL